MFSTLEAECSQAFCTVGFHVHAVFDSTVEIKLLIVGSTLLNINLPLLAGWKLSFPFRQAEQGMWKCLVAAQGALGLACAHS